MFDGVSPADKEDWALNRSYRLGFMILLSFFAEAKTCQAEFPCQDRAACKKTYSAPCPADWYALNGGMSCVAPKSYTANCSPVMRPLKCACLGRTQSSNMTFR